MPKPLHKAAPVLARADDSLAPLCAQEMHQGQDDMKQAQERLKELENGAKALRDQAAKVLDEHRQAQKKCALTLPLPVHL